MSLPNMDASAAAYLGTKATKDAGTVSGTNAFRIINESTATAIAYGGAFDDSGVCVWKNDGVEMFAVNQGTALS